MNEAEWLTCDDVRRLMEQVQQWEAPARKWQLLALACLHPLASHLLKESRDAVSVIELAAEGECSAAELARACKAVTATWGQIENGAEISRSSHVRSCANIAASFAAHPEYRRYAFIAVSACADALRYAATLEEEETVISETNR